MCDHLSMLTNFNERHDKFFSDAEELKSQMINFKVSQPFVKSSHFLFSFFKFYEFLFRVGRSEATSARYHREMSVGGQTKSEISQRKFDFRRCSYEPWKEIRNQRDRFVVLIRKYLFLGLINLSGVGTIQMRGY